MTRTVLELRLAPVARLLADINVLGRKLPMRLGDLVIDGTLGSSGTGFSVVGTWAVTKQ